ncbi:MFS transporter, partial [Frankia sp. R82]|nr:MFS transporter [Frankia sp. R82]
MSTPRVDAAGGGGTDHGAPGDPGAPSPSPSEAAPAPFFTRARLSYLFSSVGQESTTAVLAPFLAGTLGAAPVVIAGVEAAGRAGGTA